MSGLELLPALDPTPNPGPAWLFHGLLVLTFFLHVLFMNLTLGGTLMAALAQLGSRGRAGDPRTELAGAVTGVLALTGTILAVMAITRHQVRVLYLEPVSSRFEAASAPQWLNFALFAVLLVVALGTVDGR